MLETAPSFSTFNTTSSGCEDDDDEKEEQVDRDESSGESLERTITIGDSIKEATAGNEDFSFCNTTMGLIVEEEQEQEEEEETFPTEEAATPPVSPRMYLAAGLGLEGPSFGIDRRSNDQEEENLLQSKETLSGAEEDVEILLWNAKLAWELHHDQETTLYCFERAAKSSPNNSDVLAAYASFLWEIEDKEDEGAGKENHIQAETEKQVDRYVEAEPGSKEENSDECSGFPSGLTVDIANLDENAISEGGNIEDYYRKMLEKNPSNPFILAKYAKFLCESKGDFKGAEEYYSRACLTDPTDGVILADYAKLVWQLYQDHDKASFYYERAVQAYPEDRINFLDDFAVRARQFSVANVNCDVYMSGCFWNAFLRAIDFMSGKTSFLDIDVCLGAANVCFDILAAYASFLWDTEKDDLNVDCSQESNHQNEAISTLTA